MTSTKSTWYAHPVNAPKFSILIAARNEELNIENCINAAFSQDFPDQEYEVWIGDDHSTDQTALIVERLQYIYPNLNLLRIDRNIEGLLGKANVLAQLAKVARGEFFLITDADVLTPPSWVSSYADCFSANIDMLSGVVALKGNNLFAELQNADWVSYMASCAEKSEKGNPVTAVGCNMAIRASTYKEIGGYEKIPFSITEDYELFRTVVDAGYSFRSILSKEILAFTSPVKNFPELLKQRRRWLTGSFTKNWQFIVGFNLSCLFFPFLILTFFIHPVVPFLILSIKWLKEIIFLRSVYKKLNLIPNTGLYLYTPYQIICNFIYITFQFLPSPVEWKGRKYPN